MFRWLAILLVLAALAAGGAYVVAGRTPPPALSIDKPDRAVGQNGAIEVAVAVPGGAATLEALTIAVEQNDKTTPLFALDAPQSGTTTQPDGEHIRIVRPFGKRHVPELQAGAARIVVTASRRSFWGLRSVGSQEVKDIRVMLEAPRVSAVSTHHYVNHGGAEMVVYRAAPAGVESGVRVGPLEYRGYPLAGTGRPSADPSLMVAFFGLLHDQDRATPIALYARDEAGNEATAAFVDNIFPKPFKRSRIPLDDRFLQRVVPEIAAQSPELNLPSPAGDLLPAFLRINGELRRLNADRIASITERSAPTRLWQGSFVQLGNSQVEAGFADHRTYVYGGKEVDQQVHLGFDLAATARTPVVAANAGTVLHADWLGIYGLCVIVDHGMGVSSLYAHLSHVDVKPGDSVAKSQVIGRSGMTGLAGGDHLHFTILVRGRPVNPVEWWDPHWVEDRVERKLR
jgi:murein DD-endopeptidase MepM/ murein hydrolase activator NlpD